MMCTAMPLPACGAVTLFAQNHLRKTRKTPRGQGLADTRRLLILHHTAPSRHMQAKSIFLIRRYFLSSSFMPSLFFPESPRFLSRNALCFFAFLYDFLMLRAWFIIDIQPCMDYTFYNFLREVLCKIIREKRVYNITCR